MMNAQTVSEISEILYLLNRSVKTVGGMFSYSEDLGEYVFAVGVDHDSAFLARLQEIAKDRKIPAIKAFREATRCGLKEAKDAIEALPNDTLARTHLAAARLRGDYKKVESVSVWNFDTGRNEEIPI